VEFHTGGTQILSAFGRTCGSECPGASSAEDFFLCKRNLVQGFVDRICSPSRGRTHLQSLLTSTGQRQPRTPDASRILPREGPDRPETDSWVSLKLQATSVGRSKQGTRHKFVQKKKGTACRSYSLIPYNYSNTYVQTTTEQRLTRAASNTTPRW